MYDNREVGEIRWPRPDGEPKVVPIRNGFELCETQRWVGMKMLPVKANKGASFHVRPDGGLTLRFRCHVCRRPRAITEEKLSLAVDKHRKDERARCVVLDVSLLPG